MIFNMTFLPRDVPRRNAGAGRACPFQRENQARRLRACRRPTRVRRSIVHPAHSKCENIGAQLCAPPRRPMIQQATQRQHRLQAYSRSPTCAYMAIAGTRCKRALTLLAFRQQARRRVAPCGEGPCTPLAPSGRWPIVRRFRKANAIARENARLARPEVRCWRPPPVTGRAATRQGTKSLRSDPLRGGREPGGRVAGG